MGIARQARGRFAASEVDLLNILESTVNLARGSDRVANTVRKTVAELKIRRETEAVARPIRTADSERNRRNITGAVRISER